MKDTSQWNRKTGVGFLSCFYQLVSQDTLHRLTRSYGPLKRRPAEHSASCIMAALVYHFFQSQGYLSTHYQLIWKKRLSDAALSKRRLTMPWEVFEELLRAALKPLADIKLHPESFYQGLRLVAIDGTEFSVANTPQVLGQLTKATSRRFQAAIFICLSIVACREKPSRPSMAKRVPSWRSNRLPAACWPSSVIQPSIPTISSTASVRRFTTPCVNHRIDPCLTAPCWGFIRRVPPSNR